MIPLDVWPMIWSVWLSHSLSLADYVEVTEGKVTVCRDAVKGKCTRPLCKYYHIPILPQLLLWRSKGQKSSRGQGHLQGQGASAATKDSALHAISEQMHTESTRAVLYTQRSIHTQNRTGTYPKTHTYIHTCIHMCTDMCIHLERNLFFMYGYTDNLYS